MDKRTSPPPSGGRDLREYARGTQTRLIGGALFLLFIVGGGLIYLFYGPGGAALGLGCLMAALVPIGLIILGLAILERVVRREESDSGR